MEKLTVFTPTYNRAYTLERLYNSLLEQTNNSFIWLIVDDGSTDDTAALINKFISENKIKIRYCYQENAGKSQAHNKGVELCETELFVCVDSDDYLTPNAVERIIHHWKYAANLKDCIGVFALRCAGSPKKPMTRFKPERLPSDKLSIMREAFSNGAVAGDSMLVFKTDILKKVEFPLINGEKFVPEAYLYDKLDQMGKMYFTDEKIYIAEYLPDGYTNNMAKLNFNNANGYYAYIIQRLSLDTRLKNKIIDTACYISICIVLGKKPIHPQHKIFSTLLLPLGYGLYLKRYYRFKKSKE